MKIETKLALNNMRKNKKRTLYTTISLILCTTLILTTILLISSIRNGVSENFDTEYNDYHIILKDLSKERFNRIRNKTYIDKIYIQKSKNENLEKVDSSYEAIDNTTVYLKYKDTKRVCEYTNNILGELNLSELEFKNINTTCKFNKTFLTVHGYIDLSITEKNGIPTCLMRVNYSPIITLMIIILLLVFSALFIIILHNAFLITINERKKEYAILNSVGGTEGQILKMIFKEAIIMGIIGIIVGGLLSVLLSNMALSNINNILNRAGYYFNLVFDIKYIILALIIIVINIYFSVLIPSLKASSTSVIQGIRNNKEIKNKKRKTILEKIFPTEGKVAIKNIRRNKSKYRLIIFLLVVTITSFVSISTYIEYEKETASLVTEYDVDAELTINSEDTYEVAKLNGCFDYVSILKEYEKKHNKKLEYFEYRDVWQNNFLVIPTDAFVDDSFSFEFENKNKSIQMRVIALNDMNYNKYINKVKGNYGDFIVYNNTIIHNFEVNSSQPTYSYTPIFKKDSNLKLNLIDRTYQNNIWEYEIIESQILDRKIILTDEVIEGYKELEKTDFYCYPTLFMNLDTYNKMDNYIENTYGKLHSYMNDGNTRAFWDTRDNLKVKIKCDDIVEFKNYMEKTIEEKNLGVSREYYTLDNQEKILYINIVELILKIMMIAIITIGIVSTINIINASLIERKEDFNILYRMGATKVNIKKILIYECIYMFVKALIISTVLSIPIIYKIIKGMEQVLVLNKLLIPFGSIGIFIVVMFAISLTITICSTRIIKEE